MCTALLVSIAGVSQPAAEPRRRSGLLRAALLGLLVPALGPLLLAVPAGAEDPPTPAAEEDTSPLLVHLERLSPATIPTKGRLVLAGTVTNNSEETWTAINVDPFISSSPMTTRDQLAEAAASDPEAEVGTRLIEPGQFDPIGDLDPGQSAPFRISLPVKDLIGTEITGEPGVYWIGVHALGQNAEGRDTAADGRARTFIPLVDNTTAQTSVAVVVPIRERVRRNPDGRVLSVHDWAQNLAPTGRLGRISGFLESAGVLPTTLLVDPAVLDAVDDLTKENPAVSLGTNPDEGENPTESPSPSVSRDGVDRFEPADLVNAQTWLNAVKAAAQRHTTLGLAYADPDTNSLARRRPQMLAGATNLSAQTFTELGIQAQPTTAPPNGWFDEDLLDRIDPESLLLVSDHSAPRTRTRWTAATGQDLVFSDAQTSSGGPGPTAPTDALSMRQRILADAALRLPEGSTSPLVVQLPHDWDPGEGWQLADFFNELNQPWLNLVPLEHSDLSVEPEFTASLGYPKTVRREELGAANITAARTLIWTTTVFAKLLRTTNTIAHDLTAVALTAVSYHAREDPIMARQQVFATNDTMRGILGKVQVIGTDFVTLSGGSGTLAVTVVNGLDHPIVVGVEPQTANQGVRIDSTEPFEMAPGQRTVLRLHAESSGIGVDQIGLTPVTTAGTPLGTPLTFRLRTSQVGNLIWAVLGAGGLLLVVMIGRRILRGVRTHRWRGE